jgi:hypothetical protein
MLEKRPVFFWEWQWHSSGREGPQRDLRKLLRLVDKWTLLVISDLCTQVKFIKLYTLNMGLIFYIYYTSIKLFLKFRDK